LTLRQKLTGLVLAAVFAGSIAACGGDDNAASSGTDEGAIKVGLLTDKGQLNDRGFNELAYNGLKRAERELGVQGRVLQAATAADYVPNMASLVRQDYDLIIGVGFAQGDAVAKAASRFPDTKFEIIDVDQSSLPGKPKNVVGLLFKEEQVGYLAGYAAALAEKRRPGADIVSSVGGMKEPPVDRFIAGYQAGAKAGDPGVKVLNGYSQDWDDVAKCKELALTQIEQGSGVVFQVAGGCGLGALDAAKEKQVWGIGVDADQSFLGAHVLTSALKRVDEAVFSTIESVQDGTWKGGRNLVFGLSQDGVGLGTFSPKVPQEDRAAIDAEAKKIAAGDVTIPTSL
jgi:basic membrane protein A